MRVYTLLFMMWGLCYTIYNSCRGLKFYGLYKKEGTPVSGGSEACLSCFMETIYLPVPFSHHEQDTVVNLPGAATSYTAS